MLKFQNEPRRFSLSFESGPPRICVSVYRPCVSILADLFRRHRGIASHLTQWKFKKFEPNPVEGFGFDQAFAPGEWKDDYLVLKAELRREHLTTAVTFGVLLGTLGFLKEHAESILKTQAPADRSRFQLMHLESAVVLDGTWMQAPLGGTVAPVFVDWIERIAETRSELLEVEEAMWLAWNAMSQFRVKKRKGPHTFLGLGCRLGEKGSFFLSTLGNACDLSAKDWWQREKGEGYELCCHNLDTPIQQLSLLAGMAKLHDLADREI